MKFQGEQNLRMFADAWLHNLIKSTIDKIIEVICASKHFYMITFWPHYIFVWQIFRSMFYLNS